MSNYPETIYCGKNPVRTFTMNGITKFVARDICKLLGYPRADKMLAPFVRSAPEYRFNNSPKWIPKSKVPKMMVKKKIGPLGIYTRFGNFWGTFEDCEKMTEMSLI